MGDRREQSQLPQSLSSQGAEEAVSLSAANSPVLEQESQAEQPNAGEAQMEEAKEIPTQAVAAAEEQPAATMVLPNQSATESESAALDEEEEKDDEDENDWSSDHSELYAGEVSLKPGQLGCKHYLRACQLQCPDPICEGACYTCRFCHDDVMYDGQPDLRKNHRIDRFRVTHVKCLRCGLIQGKSPACTGCHEPFSKYYCEKCSLFDDMCAEKGIYHCEKCGMCKVGGRETSYHCDECDCCYKLPMIQGHTCVKSRLQQNCGVCLEDMHASRQSIIFLNCNHNIHKNCLEQYLKSSTNCPICRKSLIRPEALENYWDEEYARTPMPLAYRNAKFHILCNDCSARSLVPFHIYGGKCSQCRSYNTTRDKGDLIYEDGPNSLGEQMLHNAPAEHQEPNPAAASQQEEVEGSEASQQAANDQQEESKDGHAR